MANRTLYMDANGKIKKGFEHGQKWQFGSLGKEATYCEGIYELRQKAKDHPEYDYWMRMASTRV